MNRVAIDKRFVRASQADGIGQFTNRKSEFCRTVRTKDDQIGLHPE